MASTIKVDRIEGSTGSTITVPTGQTLTLTDGLASASLPVVGVAKGGTSFASFTAGDVLYATGSTTLAKLAKGTAEQVLAMNAGATAPDWGSVDLTVLPTISVAKGGTSFASFTAGDILYATGATTLAKLAKGTGSQTLKMNAGATAPEWATVAASGGAWNLIKEINASGDATMAFVDGTDDVVLDNTYDEYVIKFFNNDPDTYSTMSINFSIDGGSNYNVAKTTMIFEAMNNEDDAAYDFAYQSGQALGLSTGEFLLGRNVGLDADHGDNGCLHFYDLASTSKVKCFTGYDIHVHASAHPVICYDSGIINTTSAINGIRFDRTAGDMTTGKFKLYGIT